MSGRKMYDGGGYTYESARDMIATANEAVKAVKGMRFRCKSLSGFPRAELDRLVEKAEGVKDALVEQIRVNLAKAGAVNTLGETEDSRFLTLFSDARIRPRRPDRAKLDKEAQRLFGVPYEKLSANDASRVSRSLTGEHPDPDSDSDGFFYTDPVTGERLEP